VRKRLHRASHRERSLSGKISLLFPWQELKKLVVVSGERWMGGRRSRQRRVLPTTKGEREDEDDPYPLLRWVRTPSSSMRR